MLSPDFGKILIGQFLVRTKPTNIPQVFCEFIRNTWKNSIDPIEDSEWVTLGMNRLYTMHILSKLYEISNICGNKKRLWVMNLRHVKATCDTKCMDDHIPLTLMLLIANLVNTKWCKKTGKITKTQAHRYSSKSTQRELSNEYQHERI